jgi:hypothetical protein
MFAKTINELHANSVICPVSFPDMFRFLEGKENLTDVNTHLEMTERAVASPTAGQAFFLVYAPGIEAPRSQIRTTQKQIMIEVRPMIEFVDLVLHSRNSDVMLQCGDLVEVNSIVGAIAGNETLRIELSSLMSSLGLRGDGTDRGRFSSVIDRLVKWNYLIVADAEREIYRVTGKINLFRDLLDVLIEAMPGAQEEIDKDNIQGDLF